MEIIETRLGMLKKRKNTVERRAWYIVVPKGYLVLLGDGQDSSAKQRIDAYLAETLSVHEVNHPHHPMVQCLAPYRKDDGVHFWQAREFHPDPLIPARLCKTFRRPS